MSALLLDDVVDLHLSTTKFLSGRVVSWPYSMALMPSTFMKRGSTLHVLFYGVPLYSVGGYFEAMLYQCLGMHV